MDRNIYLHSTPLKEAQNLFLENAGEIHKKAKEEINTIDSLHRITAAPVTANISSPHYFASAVDGIAVKAENTYGATETSPLILSVGKDVFPLDTGQPLPGDCNAVIMIEHIEWIDNERVEIRSAATPWQHVRTVGEDILGSELILPIYHQIRPVDLGVMLSAGVNRVEVLKPPKAAIIPTGSELVAPGQEPAIGEIIDSNSSLFASMIYSWGGEPSIYPIIPDDFNRLQETVKEAQGWADLVLIIAGSSAGRKDYTAQVVKQLGELWVHGIAIRPGKPAVLGGSEEAVLVGVPGYPVSAFLVMEHLVKPLIFKWLGQFLSDPPQIEAILKRKVISTLKEEEFLRVRLGLIDHSIVAVPLSRGSGILSSVLKADGWLRIPQNTEGMPAGTSASIELIQAPEAVEGNLLCVGSHDLSLDLLNSLLKERHPGNSLAPINEGSMGGIMALKRGETHMAPLHLLDPDTGDYNLSYLQYYLPEIDLVLIHLLSREQGIILPPHNPKNISDISGLAAQEALFINRQKGAGTRILFDYLLEQHQIPASEIRGYYREEYNHLAVAAAVKSGTAEAGLGILAAAKIFGLGFIPLAQEEYQLAIPRTHLEAPGVQRLLDTIASEKFAEEVKKWGGYDPSKRGKMVWEQNSKTNQ